MPGIAKTLGSWATGLIRKAKDVGLQLGEVLGLVKPVAPEIEPMAAARDFGRVSTADALSPEIVASPKDELLPHVLYTVSDIPWKEKYAYEISIFGRGHDGQFKRMKHDVPFSREMTPQEIEDYARSTFVGDKYEFMEIFDVAVTGAWKSAEVEW